MTPDTTPDIRLSDLLARTVEEGDCLLWTGYATQGKYPQWRIKNINRPARRVVYEAVHGPIKPGLQVGVNCGCDLCMHPDHLVARPKKLAMRRIKMTRAKRMNIAHARRAKSAKLTIELVREIRASDEPGNVIEKRMGLVKGYASRIRLGKLWADHASPFAGLGASNDAGRLRA